MINTFDVAINTHNSGSKLLVAVDERLSHCITYLRGMERNSCRRLQDVSKVLTTRYHVMLKVRIGEISN